MNIPCAKFSPCPDVYPPYTNLSSEDPDRYVCIGRSWGNYQSPPRIGSAWTEANCYQTCELSLSDIDLIQCRALGKDMCSGECVQSVSQELADQCAANLSQCGDQCDTTGRACFYNTTQSCTVTCPDGTEFTYTVNAGTFSATSVALANNQAYSFACQQANALKHCTTPIQNTSCNITTGSTLPVGVIGIPYSEQIVGSATGSPNIYSITGGSLPPGLSMNATGDITGTPTTGGDYSFVVHLRGGLVTSCNKAFNLSITAITTPTAYWKLEEASGTRFDALGVANNNLLVAATDVPNAVGIKGMGLRFNNAPMPWYNTTLATNLNYDPLSNGITLCYWIKPVNVTQFRAYLFDDTITFLTDVLPDRARFVVQWTGPDVTADVMVDMVPQNWHFIACQFRQSDGKSYVSVDNGPFNASPTAVGIFSAPTGSRFYVTPISGGDSVLDEVGIWVGTVLDSAQITALYNNGHGRTYPFI